MGDISKEELRKEVADILKDADLASMSAKKVRQQIEEKLDIDLTSRKKEVDDIVMECLKANQESKSKNSKKNGKEDDDEDEEEDEEEDAEEEEEEEEEPPKKKAAPAKKPPAKRAKKSSSEEESEGGGSAEEGSEDEDSDAPKKSKGAKKGKSSGRKKKKGSDSDSDEDWAKTRRSSGGGGGGGGRKKGGGAKKGGGSGKGSAYTRAYTLSPELSDLLGEESMPRHEVVKRVWALIKEKNLYDPKNKQFAICDEPLLKVIGQKRFRIFGMMKHLKNHFLD